MCLILLISPFYVLAQLQQGEFAIGDTNYNEGYSIIQSRDGGYVIAGLTFIPLSGANNFYVVKLDSKGNLQWTQSIGGNGNEEAYAIVETKDGGYAIGGSTNSYGAGGYDMYIVKLDSMGALKWTKTIGGFGSDICYSLVQSKDGGFALTGYTFAFGNGGSDVYIVKLDSTGNLKWTKTVGGANSEQGNSIIQTYDGGYAITGLTRSYGAGNSDVYVVKIDSAGNLLWTKTIGGRGDDIGNSIIQTHDGGYAIAGYTNSFGVGNNDMYIIRLDSLGTLKWTNTFGGAGTEEGNSIIQTWDGGYALGGYTNSYGAGGFDVYLIKLDSSDILQWTKVIGGANSEMGHSLIQTKDKGFGITGITTTFGLGKGDFYFIKLDSSASFCNSINSGGSITRQDSGLVSSGGLISSGATLSSGGTESALGVITNVCNVISTSKNKYSANSYLEIFPNPCSTTLTIDFETPSNLSSIQIMDITGRVLLTDHCLLTTDHYSIDVSALVPGMYFLRINSGSATEVKKFIKE